MVPFPVPSRPASRQPSPSVPIPRLMACGGGGGAPEYAPPLIFVIHIPIHTAKTQYGKQIFPEKEKELSSFTLALFLYNATKILVMCSQKRSWAGLSPNFHIHVFVSDVNIPTNWSAYSAGGKYVDQSW